MEELPAWLSRSRAALMRAEPGERESTALQCRSLRRTLPVAARVFTPGKNIGREGGERGSRRPAQLEKRRPPIWAPGLRCTGGAGRGEDASHRSRERRDSPASREEGRRRLGRGRGPRLVSGAMAADAWTVGGLLLDVGEARDGVKNWPSSGKTRGSGAEVDPLRNPLAPLSWSKIK